MGRPAQSPFDSETLAEHAGKDAWRYTRKPLAPGGSAAKVLLYVLESNWVFIDGISHDVDEPG